MAASLVILTTVIIRVRIATSKIQRRPALASLKEQKKCQESTGVAHFLPLSCH